MSDSRTFNNTNYISKPVNQYTTDVVNSYKGNKVSNLNKAYYDFIDGVVFLINITPYTIMVIPL